LSKTTESGNTPVSGRYPKAGACRDVSLVRHCCLGRIFLPCLSDDWVLGFQTTEFQLASCQAPVAQLADKLPEIATPENAVTEAWRPESARSGRAAMNIRAECYFSPPSFKLKSQRMN
jgi:hypothetical protein